MTDGYTAGLVNQLPIGASTTWTPAALKMDLAAFQAVVVKLDELEADSLVRVLEKHKESGTGNRFFDLVRFKRTK